MKQSLSLTFAILGLAAIACASPVTLSDPFGVGSPDVIGALDKYDIQKVVVDVTGTDVTAKIYTNFGPGNTTIAPFSYDGGTSFYTIGDLFFTIGGTLKYGTALYQHDGTPNNSTFNAAYGAVNVGELFQISNLDNGTFTSQEALPGYVGDSRPSEIVLLRNLDAGLSLLGTGVTVNPVATAASPEFVITVTIPKAVSTAFYNDMASGNWGVHFASASCGNDILDGRNPGVPEPGTFVMLGGALLGLGLLRRRLA